MAACEITVTRSQIRSCGPGPEWYWHYYATGPDTIESGGRTLPRRWDNRSIVELRRLLKRAYGSDVRIIEPWKRATS